MINFYTLFLLFISCAFIGWILECILIFYEEKRFINRGFLTGPVCPLYGLGASLIVVLFKDFKGNFIELFLVTTLLVAVVEYLTSYILEKIFNTRWWDYSKEKYNINGRLNIVTLVAFGVFGLILIYGYYPMFNKILLLIPKNVTNIISIILFIIFSIDASLSLVVAYEFKKDSMYMAEELKKVDSTEKILQLKRNIIKKRKSYKRLFEAFPKLKFNFIKLKKKIKKTIPKK